MRYLCKARDRESERIDESIAQRYDIAGSHQ